MKDRRVSSKDVAREAGVSQATVSYVLNNNPNVKIRPETRQAVIDAARRLNYHVDFIARNMRLRKSASVGIVTDADMSNFPFVRALEGIKASLVERNYSVVMCFGTGSDIQDAEYIKYYFSNLIDGIIFVMRDLKQEDVKYLEKNQIPYVSINGNAQPNARYQVKTDMRQAVTLAIAQLKAKGITNVGYLGQFAGNEKSMRFSAYRYAMRENKLRVASRHLYPINDNENLIFDEICGQLDGIELPQAIVCDNVNMGFYTLRYMNKNGIRVPEDVSLIQLGTTEFSRRTYPTISAVEAPLYNMGLRGSELLFDIMDYGYGVHGDPIVLQWQYNQRESSW